MQPWDEPATSQTADVAPCSTCAKSNAPAANDTSEESYGAGLRLVGTPSERAALKADLATLESTATGRKILRMIDADARRTGGRVTLSDGSWGGQHASGNLYKGGVLQEARANALRVERDWTGRIEVVEAGRPIPPSDIHVFVDHTSRPAESPASASLAHELIHAHHAMNGTMLSSGRYSDASDVGTAGGSNHEEARAIGRGAYASDSVTENAFRRDRGLPQRSTHSGLPGRPTP